MASYNFISDGRCITILDGNAKPIAEVTSKDGCTFLKEMAFSRESILFILSMMEDFQHCASNIKDIGGYQLDLF